LHVVATINHIIWTVLHVVVPAGKNRKDKTAVQNENKIGVRKKKSQSKKIMH